MGAWGTGSFENDTALDWLGDLTEQDSGDLLFEALDIGGLDQIDGPDGDVAVAAAEVVAALGQRSSKDVPDELTAWLAKGPDLAVGSYRAMCIAALERVLSPDSESHQLWAETDELEVWRSGVTELLQRVREIPDLPPATRPEVTSPPTKARPWWRFWS